MQPQPAPGPFSGLAVSSDSGELSYFYTSAASGRRVTIYFNQRPWDDAVSACAASGGRLLVPSGLDDLRQYQQAAAAAMEDSKESINHFWLGAERLVGAGKADWTTAAAAPGAPPGPPLSPDLLRWRVPGWPPDGPSQVRLCLALLVESTLRDGLWVGDYLCDEPMRYACTA